ncbi:hypothetical protein AwWohl_08540 [Gammaproteobacteria bacterium]|nr:hypothetical protein AwWohl_08540 [Gammaproteobacteria bacterium]
MLEATRLFCYGKIHRARVTDANLNYIGSITIDPILLRAAHIFPYTQVDVVNINNGQRLQTYAIEGVEGSGQICLNGAAAHHFSPDDLCIIMGYEQVPLSLLPNKIHRAVLVDAALENKICSIRELKVPASIDQIGNNDQSSQIFTTDCTQDNTQDHTPDHTIN